MEELDGFFFPAPIFTGKVHLENGLVPFHISSCAIQPQAVARRFPDEQPQNKLLVEELRLARFLYFLVLR